MKKMIAVLVTVTLSAVLSGCMLKSGDDLLSLPKPPSDYIMLQKNLDEITAQGATLSSPNTGKNQAPIQLVDIDADGEPEAISLFKLSDETGQFRVYVHKKDGDAYRELGYIEGHGDSIESIYYPRVSSVGERGILVSWRLGSLERGMTICLLENEHIKTALDGEYSKLVIDDLDQNGSDEVLTIMSDAKAGRYIAKLHKFRNNTVKIVGEAPLSDEAAGIGRITTGSLSDGARAVFVDSAAFDSKGLVTDVFALKNDDLINLSLNDATGSGDKTFRSLAVYCSDIDLDGVVEIPVSELMPGYRDPESPEAQWSLLWSRFSSDGSSNVLFRTYHNFSEEWYLAFKDTWAGNITVSRDSSANMRYTTFSLYKKREEPIPLLKIYAFTGDYRETQAKAAGYIYLGSSSSTAYAAVIPDSAAGQDPALNELELKQYFHIIPKRWDTDIY